MNKRQKKKLERKWGHKKFIDARRAMVSAICERRLREYVKEHPEYKKTNNLIYLKIHKNEKYKRMPECTFLLNTYPVSIRGTYENKELDVAFRCFPITGSVVDAAAKAIVENNASSIGNADQEEVKN